MDVKKELEGMAFGMADGVICFLGILIGVAAATGSAKMVIIAGAIGGIADAFGNSIGFYISQSMERGIQTYEKKKKDHTTRVNTYKEVVMNAVFSFIGTIIVLVLLMAPFFLASLDLAIKISFFLGITTLFLLGVYVSKLMDEKPLKMGIEFAIIGIIGALLGYAVGEGLRLLLLNGA